MDEKKKPKNNNNNITLKHPNVKKNRSYIQKPLNNILYSLKHLLHRFIRI